MADAKAAKPKVYVQYTDHFGKKLRGDEFGNLAPYRNGRPHRGGDWAPKELAPIKAFCAGKVTNVFWSNVLGWVVEVLAADGVYTQYSHVAPKTVSVDKGEMIEAGEVIGKVGGGRKTPSGSASTGAHLHVAMGKVKDCHLADRSKLIDPFKWIDAHSKPAPTATAAPAAPAATASADTPVADAPIASTTSDEHADVLKIDLSKKPKIKPGDKGAYVAYVQKKFNQTPTGIYDGKLKKAVIKLQKDNKYVADGVFGNLTWNKVIDL